LIRHYYADIDFITPLITLCAFMPLSCRFSLFAIFAIAIFDLLIDAFAIFAFIPVFSYFHAIIAADAIDTLRH